MSNKDNNHIVDTNKKVSSVDWFLEQIMYADVDVKVWKEIAQQAKAMHKEEIEDAVGVGSQFDRDYLYGYHDKAEQYYQQTYGE